MKVYIDNIIFHLQDMGGISVYFAEMIERLLTSDNDVNFIEQKAIHNNMVRGKISIQDDRIVTERHWSIRLGSYTPIRFQLRQKAIVHSSYYRTCYDPNAANIVTVYDFNYEFYRHGIPKYIHSYIKNKSVNNADGIICISRNTRDDLLKLYGNIDPDNIAVIYLGAGRFFSPIDYSQMYPINSDILTATRDDRFILYVGARVHHKNFDLAVETLYRMKKFKLVIVGGTKLSSQEIGLLERKLKGRYIYFGKVPDPELNYLYNKAFCFLYPTSYEGFGIPVLEAMKAGCPVVSTNVSSIPEVTGNAGLLVDNIEPDAFVEKILSLENASYRKKVINAGFEQARKFSWDKTYQETVQFYKKIFAKKFGEEVSSQ